MSSPRHSPQTEKAQTYLYQKINSEIGKTSSRLPSIAEMSKEATVSLVSMWKAVKNLCTKGKLTIRPGIGTFISCKSDSASNFPEDMPTQVTTQLLHDILESQYQLEEELPSLKVLTKTYGTSSRTLRTSINSLIADKFLAKSGNRITIKNDTSLYGITILFIYGPDYLTSSEGSYFRNISDDFLKHLERQCSIRNIRILRCAIHKEHPLPLAQIAQCAGCILWDVGSRLDNRIGELLQHLASIRKPSAFIDHTDPVYVPHGIPSKVPIKIFQNDNRGAGRIMGNALICRGHRSVCFISEKHEEWPRHRYEGIKSAFDQAGFPDAVHWITRESTTPLKVNSSIGKKSILDSNYIEKLRTKVLASDLDVAVVSRIISRLEKASHQSRLFANMEAVLEGALLCKTASAWIAGDDDIALHAVLPFCEKKRIGVPKKLSVVSFNNHLESSLSNLTTYQFDMSNLCLRVLTFLTSPENERRLRPNKSESRIEGIQGYIVVRGTLNTPKL